MEEIELNTHEQLTKLQLSDVKYGHPDRSTLFLEVGKISGKLYKFMNLSDDVGDILRRTYQSGYESEVERSRDSDVDNGLGRQLERRSSIRLELNLQTERNPEKKLDRGSD
ncbi:potassium transporter 11 [Tanacetum coccineum]